MDYLIGYVGKFHFDVIWPFEWCHEVEVGDVHCHKLGSFGRDDAVEEHLGNEHVSRWGGYFARIVDAFAAHCESRVVGIVFFWSDCTDKLAVGDISPSVLWNGVVWYEFDGVCALDAYSYVVG